MKESNGGNAADKDEHFFDYWWQNNGLLISPIFENGYAEIKNYKDCKLTWMEACEYKQKEIDEVEKSIVEIYKSEGMVIEVFKKLQAENAKLRECVEFYADIISWDKCGGERIRIKDEDIYLMNNLPFGGKRARQVLKELE